MHHRALWPLTKRSNQGFRGHPIGTLAFYRPDDHRATKVAVGVVTREGQEPAELKRWFCDESDVRDDEGVNRAIVAFMEHYGVKTIVLTNGIIGCPHEEGVDYPSGGKCPECPFWATRDRWSGDVLH